MIKELKQILNKTYDNPVLRKTTCPLILTNPGVGKTQIINEFAQQRGVNMYTMILSQLMPSEVSGITMPDIKTRKMIICDSELLLSLKDGDILFIDECLTALKQTLDAFLNLIQDRRLPSGKKLADIMLIACSNPQGMPNLSPAIKQRFIMYDLKFNAEEYQEYLKDKYGMPEVVSKNLSILIGKEKFESITWNYMTPRSLEKAINQIGCELQSPYDDVLLPFLKHEIVLENSYGDLNYKKGDKIEYLTVLKTIIKKRNEVVTVKPTAKTKKTKVTKEELTLEQA